MSKNENGNLGLTINETALTVLSAISGRAALAAALGKSFCGNRDMYLAWVTPARSAWSSTKPNISARMWRAKWSIYRHGIPGASRLPSWMVARKRISPRKPAPRSPINSPWNACAAYAANYTYGYFSFRNTNSS